MSIGKRAEGAETRHRSSIRQMCVVAQQERCSRQTMRSHPRMICSTCLSERDPYAANACLFFPISGTLFSSKGLHVGPGGMSPSGWPGRALSPALLEGEDDALVDGAAFQLAVGKGDLLHGHGCVRAQAEPAIGQQGDRPSKAPGARSLVGWESVTPKSEAAGSDKVIIRLGPPARAIASARTPLPAASNTASTAASTRTRLAGPAVPHRRRSQLAGERFVLLADRADHLDPPGDRELRRDDADGSAAAEQQQRLTALDVSCRRTPTAASAELGSAAASIHETGSGLRVQIDASAYSA